MGTRDSSHPQTIFLREDESSLDDALAKMILSPSGWRGVFAGDGNEESSVKTISAAHTVIVSVAAKVFADYLKTGKEHPVIIVGMDTRPTGGAIAEAMIRAFAAEACEVAFANVTAAPEIMAYARTAGNAGKADGFVYISASHNPIGHNGLKFGRTDGGVLSPEEASQLLAGFRAFMAAPDRIARVAALANRADQNVIDRVYRNAYRIKEEAYNAYLAFTQEVVFGLEGKTGPSELFNALTEGLRLNPLGIAVDFNGSARTVSIDRQFFSRMGIRCYAINDKPGAIAHRIVPEGDSLEPCRRFLEETRREHPETILGYVPDCDGDRGNLVIWDQGAKKARSLEAQEVFALACIGELAHLVWTGTLRYDAEGKTLDKIAVVVNDPTSMRIDRIAGFFGVSVFRAEVGEPNVVGLARRLREQGYIVRILGEGSAGGNITHPSAVRDPINTVMALVKLLTLRGNDRKKGFYELWLNRSDQAESYRNDFSLSDIVASLPAFITTGSYTPEAALHVKTKDHEVLKDRYQKVFLKAWEERKEQLQTRYNIQGWEASWYKGMEERRGISRFSEAGKGGLKIAFTNNLGNQTAWIWMRGSATEPVFRVMADAEGSDPRLERDLIEWQRRMVIEADELSSMN
ncbi:MAG: phosphatidylglycerol lysyltransferase [Spirochaetaceae bacterium]|jgi:phosphoglucomutase|nr:phosphatidylglycerol lysyltransferase [Spirochaetaceae bacterium]